MKIDKELTLLVSFALAYIAENTNFTEDMHNKAEEILDALSPWAESFEDNEEVLDELIQNIKSIQEKIDAYNDLEY